MEQIQKAVIDQVRHARAEQKFKYAYVYTVTGIVLASQSKTLTMAIEQDADFLVERMTGSAFGPCDASTGLPLSANTDFPKAGVPAGEGHAGRGLTMGWKDTGSGRELSRGQIPVECLLTPGYDQGFHLPFPYKYYAMRNSKIQFDFRNRDTQANHNITVVWAGQKFQTPEVAF